MTEYRRDIARWKVFAARLLHPIPVFLIVTGATALVYAVPNLREAYDSRVTALFGTTTLILDILIPVATGCVAAFGAWFAFMDLRRKAAHPSGETGDTPPYQAEYRSKAIARHLPLAAITLDPDGNVTYLNPAASDLLDAHGNDLQNRVHRFLDCNGLHSSMEEVFRGTAVNVEKAGILPDNPDTERTWKISGVPITRQEEVVEALFIIEDRTQYRMLEDELIRSEDRYRNIFNHAPCGIFFTDSHGNYLDANPSALAMLGYSLEELTALNTRELSADSDRRLRRLKETPGWVEEETRYLRKDGKVVEAELLASSYQSGNNTYFIGITKDVTTRKELERKLSAARARLKALLSLESRPLILLDARNRIANMNAAAAELLSTSTDKLVGLALEDLIVGDLPPVQLTSSASPSPCVFKMPDSLRVNLSVIRLSLGSPDNQGSLLLLTAGPLPIPGSR